MSGDRLQHSGVWASHCGPGCWRTQEAPHRFAVIQRLFGNRVAQRIPVLQKVNPQHSLERHWRASALRSCLRMAHTISVKSRVQGTTASISARNCSRRVTFFFVSRRPGMAGCFGVGRAPPSSLRSLSDQAESGGFFRGSLATHRRPLSISEPSQD